MQPSTDQKIVQYKSLLKSIPQECNTQINKLFKNAKMKAKFMAKFFEETLCVQSLCPWDRHNAHANSKAVRGYFDPFSELKLHIFKLVMRHFRCMCCEQAGIGSSHPASINWIGRKEWVDGCEWMDEWIM